MSPSFISDFEWNENAGRYIDIETGKFVSSKSVRDALENIMETSANNMHNLSEQLISGEISILDWKNAMKEQIKLAHTAAGASANGGWAQMTQSDWGATGQLIREQYDYLRNFAKQISNGEQGINGQILTRADMYGEAARGTFETMRQRVEVANGMEEERRILERDGGNCEGCLEQAELEWQPIGTLDPIGAEECVTNCRCEFEYRKMGEDGQWEESE